MRPTRNRTSPRGREIHVMGAVMALLALSLLLGTLGAQPAVMAASPPSLDPNTSSSAAGQSLTSPVSVTISTTDSPDVIVVIVTVGPLVSSASIGTPTDTAGLTYTSECSVNAAVTAGSVAAQMFYAVASRALSSDTISAAFGTGTGVSGGMVAFAVSGAYTSAPFDPATCPSTAVATGTGTTASVSFTTAGTGDMLVGAIGVAGTAPAYTMQSGYHDIASSSSTTFVNDAEEVTTTTAGSQSVSYTVSGQTAWAMIGEALVSTSGIPDLPYGLLPLLIAVPVIYLWAVKGKTKGANATR